MWRGLSSYIHVLSRFKEIGLLRYLLITASVALALIALILLGAYSIGATRLIEIRSISDLGSQLVAFAGMLAWLSLGLLLFKRLVMVLAAPWLNSLARRTIAARREVGSRNPTGDLGITVRLSPKPTRPTLSSWQGIKRSLRINTRFFLLELALSLPLLLLSLIPVINIAALLLLFVVQSYFIGASALDASLEEGYDYRASLAFIHAHRGLCLGVGIGFSLLLLTAVGFLLAPAWSVAAAGWAYAAAETSWRQRETTSN